MSLQSLDTGLLRFVRTHGHPPPLEAAVKRFSALGEHGGIWLGVSLAGAVLDRGRRDRYLRAARTVATAYVTNQLIKVAVRRPRPRLDDLPRLTDTTSNLSYPSAHATTSLAGAHALRDLLPAVPLYAVALTLAATRPYLGVHYPSDSVAGGVLGVAVAELLA